MKKNNFRLGIIILTLSIGTTSQMRAQFSELDFVYGGVADAEKLMQAYLEPFANILGSDLNAGWYNTARPHQLGGLDVTATVSMAKAPSALLTFDVSALDLNGVIVPGSPTEAPTIAGSMDERPDITYSETVSFPDGSTQDIEYARYTVPNGSGVDYFPLPMLQLTVGLPVGTDVSVRFVPMVQLAEYGEIGLWGVGGKHSISQWLPGIKQLKFLDISLQGGYTSVSSSANVDVEPLEEVGGVPVVDPVPTLNNWNDQFIVQNVSGWTANLIASQTISVLTVYEGIGYANSLVELAMQGHFPVHTVVTEEGENFGKPSYDIVEDPFTLRYENMSNLRLNIGVRIKLGVLTLHYDFTHTLYATHSVGVGISFR